MKTTLYALLLSLMLFGLSKLAFSQKTNEHSGKLPIATQLLLDGVKSADSQKVIKSVLRIECAKAGNKGTGFLVLGAGVITTNSHVVEGCSAAELTAFSSLSEKNVKFSAMVKDDNRDLALLCPTEQLTGGLKLAGDQNPEVTNEVETWGYPLRYNGSAPILSKGYVAGYDVAVDSEGQIKRPIVGHLIVNGAFNPGNSGGPLIEHGEVIGIVVEKATLYLPNVESTITGLAHPGAITGGGAPLTIRYPNGEVKNVSQQEAIRVSLQELYEDSQVMIGEAIQVAELNAFIKEKKKNLTCASK